MAQLPVQHGPGLPDAQVHADGDHSVVRPSAELRVERSRFSRLLARFGLGELTDPILRPADQPAERSRLG